VLVGVLANRSCKKDIRARFLADCGKSQSNFSR